MVASYLTTFFMSAFEAPTTSYNFFYISPIDVAQDLITAAFRVIRDGDIFGLFSEPIIQSSRKPSADIRPLQPPGFIKGFIRRFLIGLPLVGAGSIVHMMLSLQMLAPVQFIARYRANRNRRDSSKDIAALIVIALVVAGALRYFLRYLPLLATTISKLQGTLQGLPDHGKVFQANADACGRGNFGGQLNSLNIDVFNNSRMGTNYIIMDASFLSQKANKSPILAQLAFGILVQGSRFLTIWPQLGNVVINGSIHAGNRKLHSKGLCLWPSCFRYPVGNEDSNF